MSAQDLAAAVRARRSEMGMSQVAIGAAGGPSHQTVRNIEQGTLPRRGRLTLGALDRALRWEPGSALALLELGTPPAPVRLPELNAERVGLDSEQARALRIGQLVMQLTNELAKEFGR